MNQENRELVQNESAEATRSVSLPIRLIFLLGVIGIAFWVGRETWTAFQLARYGETAHAEVVGIVDGRIESYDLRLLDPELQVEVQRVSKHLFFFRTFSMGDKVEVIWVSDSPSTMRFKGYLRSFLFYLPMCLFMFWSLGKWGYWKVIQNRFSHEMSSPLKKLFK